MARQSERVNGYDRHKRIETLERALERLQGQLGMEAESA